MNPNHSSEVRSRIRILPILLCGLMAFPLLLGFEVISFFRLSGDAAALRQSALEVLPGKWDNKVTLHPGFFTIALVRAGAPFFKLPPEAQAAISSVRGLEVAVFKPSHATADWVDTGAVLSRADEAMSARRWTRVVGVSRTDELVAVYAPRGGGVTSDSIRTCVLVLHRNDMVVAGANAKVEPLVEIAQQHLEFSGLSRGSRRTELAKAGGLVPVGYMGHQ